MEPKVSGHPDLPDGVSRASGTYAEYIRYLTDVASMVQGPTRRSKYAALPGKPVKFVHMRGPGPMDG